MQKCNRVIKRGWEKLEIKLEINEGGGGDTVEIQNEFEIEKRIQLQLSRRLKLYNDEFKNMIL